MIFFAYYEASILYLVVRLKRIKMYKNRIFLIAYTNSVALLYAFLNNSYSFSSVNAK